MTSRVAFIALLLVGCLGGCTMFVSKQEYAAYRAVRMADGDEARLLAMQRYVAAFPEGSFHGEVQEQRQARDTEVFESGKATRGGLELYLAAFPDGAFVEQARSRLAAIAVIEERRRQEQARAAALVEARKQRDEELRRTWVTRFVGYWVETLLSVDDWGAPIEQVARANAAFSTAFARPPRPRCTREECVKYYDSGFGVPVPGGTRIERHMRLVLRLGMEQGKVERAMLLLPGWGFSRWAELEQRRPVIDGDPEDRKGAVAWAMARILPAIEKRAGGGPSEEAGYALAEIAPPPIAPSGELTDTTAADPSAPANRIQGSAPAGVPGGPQPKKQGAQPSVAELVQPEEPEDTDMVMAPLGVDESGRAVQATEMRMEPLQVPQGGDQEGEGAPVMDMAPIAVGPDGQPLPAGSAEDVGAALEAQALIAPAVTRAFRVGDLRVVVFAAGTDAGAPAYDGVLVERVAPVAPARGRRR